MRHIDAYPGSNHIRNQNQFICSKSNQKNWNSISFSKNIYIFFREHMTHNRGKTQHTSLKPANKMKIFNIHKWHIWNRLNSKLNGSWYFFFSVILWRCRWCLLAVSVHTATSESISAKNVINFVYFIHWVEGEKRIIMVFRYKMDSEWALHGTYVNCQSIINAFLLLPHTVCVKTRARMPTSQILDENSIM